MLHPARLDFGKPWNYVSADYTESWGTNGSAPTVQVNGIRLAAGASAGGYSTTQRLSELKPAAGKKFLVAGRFLLSTLTNANLWFGAWQTEGDPINITTPSSFDAVFIEKTSPTATGIRGRRIKIDGGTVRDDTTANLVTLTADTFVDVAVLFLEDDAVQFLALRSDGAWSQKIIDTYIPTTILRPSVAVQRSALGVSSLNCDVRSFFAHEEM
jgi:hypothetical protein